MLCNFRVSNVFGDGLRMCPGHTFAKVRLFLLMVTLLQRFDLRPDLHNPPTDLIPEEVTVTAVAKIVKFKCCFVPR